MDQTIEVKERSSNHPADAGEAPASAAPAAIAERPCPACGTPAGANANGGAYGFVYAVGRVEVRFPTLAVEKEFAQATGRAETAGLTDRQALHSVLSQRHNRYLVRQLCWVLTIESLEPYILQPRDP